MTKVKFQRVISFSSEHPNHKADNLISGVPSTSGSKKWRCLDVGEPRASIVLQATEPIQVSSIDIGNDGSAFVEVLVRRAVQACGQSAGDDGFRTLLPASSFLTPLESRNEECMSRVRMFGPEKLSQALSQQKWDQFKVVCTQPFNKRLRYGLNFFTVHASATEKGSSCIQNGVNPAKEAKVTKLGAFFLKDEPKETDLGYKAPIGSLFAAKRHTTVASESKPMSIAASLRSEATLAEIACEANKHKRKNSDKFPSPDISLVLKTEEQKKESHKKRKVGTSLERKEVIKPCLNLSLALNKESKLPRRDILPGERPLTPLPPNVPGKIDTSLERRTVTKPFPRLMEGVKFVISGYQNPRRSELRQKALDMGAKYNADWDNSCTHLVCAYINTPKFNQVRKQSTKAKIVKCDWIESSYKNKIRYPWRRFCLDPKDSGTRADESEDEISEEKIYESKPLKESLSKVDDHHNSIVDDNQYDKNTDDEIEELLKEGKNDGKNHKPVLNDKIIASTIKNVEEDCDSAYNQETDEEEPEREMNGYHNTNEIKEDSDDAYNADTDVDAEEVHRNDTLNSPIPPKLEKRILSIELDENCSDIVNNALPELQTHFCGLNFFLYGVYSDDEKYVVKKCILSSGGSVEKVIGPNVNYVVCVDASREWDRNLDLALKEAPEVKFVRSQFITDCCKKGHLLKAPDYYI